VPVFLQRWFLDINFGLLDGAHFCVSLYVLRSLLKNWH
jgi:hypothetical protein